MIQFLIFAAFLPTRSSSWADSPSQLRNIRTHLGGVTDREGGGLR